MFILFGKALAQATQYKYLPRNDPLHLLELNHGSDNTIYIANAT